MQCLPFNLRFKLYDMVALSSLLNLKWGILSKPFLLWIKGSLFINFIFGFPVYPMLFSDNLEFSILLPLGNSCLPFQIQHQYQFLGVPDPFSCSSSFPVVLFFEHWLEAYVQFLLTCMVGSGSDGFCHPHWRPCWSSGFQFPSHYRHLEMNK